MLDRTIVLGTIAACMLATPVAAQAPAPAPTTTAFDGTYALVSQTLEGTIEPEYAGRDCRGNRPAPLTIANGTATWLNAVGSISPEGVLVMRYERAGVKFQGQIDGQGTVKGRWTGYCNYQMVWQKSGK
jgi:hypothetical protein